MRSSQGKNAPSNPYPHYLVRLATSRTKESRPPYLRRLGFSRCQVPLIRKLEKDVAVSGVCPGPEGPRIEEIQSREAILKKSSFLYRMKVSIENEIFIPGPFLGLGLKFSIENEIFKLRVEISSENENFVRGGMVFSCVRARMNFFDPRALWGGSRRKLQESPGKMLEKLSRITKCNKFYHLEHRERQTCREPWVDTAWTLSTPSIKTHGVVGRGALWASNCAHPMSVP